MGLIRRYPDHTRLNHWAVALLFVLAALSGLSIFHPALYFLSGLLGGGTWARILHPFIGVLMALGFLLLFVQVWRENVWKRSDRDWVRHAPAMLAGDKRELAQTGKNNAGQKLVFWVFALSLVVLFATGFIFWQPWFADAFPVPLRRVAVLLHAIAAVVLILSVIVHVYAAIWIKGTMRAMTRGTVSEAWARKNHPRWYRETTERR